MLKKDKRNDNYLYHYWNTVGISTEKITET